MKIPQLIRNKIATISTHDANSYYDKPCIALALINDVLAATGLYVGPQTWDDYQPDYRATIELYNEHGQRSSEFFIVFAWHIMDVSKRYEITCYMTSRRYRLKGC
mgnify:CR=1 FL=1